MSLAEPSSDTQSSPWAQALSQLHRVAQAPMSPGAEPGALSSAKTQSASAPQPPLTRSVQNSRQRPASSLPLARHTPRHSSRVAEGSQAEPTGSPLGASSTHSPLTGSQAVGVGQSADPLQRGRHSGYAT